MYSRLDIIKKVQHFTSQIINAGIPIDRVILFGSYAKNNAHNNSDIDVALISNVFSGFGFEDRKKFSKINIKKEFIDIETKTFSSDYFENGDPFTEEILTSGIEIYNSKSANLDLQFN
jgi:predicted nucleotidyltransferase